MWHISLLYAVALVIKPHTSPVTLLHMGVALGLRGLFEILPWRGWGLTRTVFLRLVKIAVLSILIVLPLYVLILQRTWEYFYNIIFGQYSNIWAFHGSLWDFFQYFLRGDGAHANSGHYIWPLIGVSLLGTGVSFYKRDREAGGFGFLALVAMGISLTATVSGKSLNPFFAGPFYVMAIGMAVYWIGHGYRWLERRHPPAALAAAAFLCAVGLCTVRWPSIMHVGAPSRPYVLYSHRLTGEIFQTILAHREKDGPTHVFLAGVTPVISPDLAIMAMQSNIPLDAADAGVENSPAAIEDRLAKADIAIAQEQQLYGAPDYMPDEKFQDQLLSWIRQNKAMQQIAEFGGPDGRAIAVFVHRHGD